MTNVAARVPHTGSLTVVAKRFRRQLSSQRLPFEELLSNYFGLLRRRTDIDSIFIADLTDLAKPYAKRMEYISLVRDGDKNELVNGHWCVEVYCLDRKGII